MLRNELSEETHVLTKQDTYLERALGHPGGSAGKESACSTGDLGSIPGLGRSPGEGKGYPLQYSGLENSMDCMVHEVAKSRTGLSDFHFTGGWGKESSRYGNPGLLGHMAPVSGFMVMGLASRFSLANHSD